ncbi:hypothetical protein DFH11DRAFT_1728388 [Phellopilus nigrolimitatus]|nr:hypothetical protein DFH11DRAFT_1728388 [Phellopilus nigrolimitatus]
MSMGDGDDVVPIGGEEDDMMELAAFKRDANDAYLPLEPPSPVKSSYDASTACRTSVRRVQWQSLEASLMYTLSPKAAGPSFRAHTQSHSNFMGASVMSGTRRPRDIRRLANGSKPSSKDSDELPPGWLTRAPSDNTN